MPGTLYICSTPIGNLEDITLRALRVLREVDLIVGEDTRRTRKLLSHYGIQAKFAPSLYEGVEKERTRQIVELLEKGHNVALVSDAGTPLIADPGYGLVAACVAQGIPVVPIPGPSALLAALVASGLPTDRFQFWGYLPRQEGKRRKALAALQGVAMTTVLYESPHRLIDTLQALAEMFPARPVVVARELTKVHEEFVRGTAAEVCQAFCARGEVKGEVVIVVGPAAYEPAEEPEPQQAQALFQELVAGGMDPKRALREVARQLNLSRKEVYRLVHRAQGGQTPSEHLQYRDLFRRTA